MENKRGYSVAMPPRVGRMRKSQAEAPAPTDVFIVPSMLPPPMCGGTRKAASDAQARLQPRSIHDCTQKSASFQVSRHDRPGGPVMTPTMRMKLDIQLRSSAVGTEAAPIPTPSTSLAAPSVSEEEDGFATVRPASASTSSVAANAVGVDPPLEC